MQAAASLPAAAPAVPTSPWMRRWALASLVANIGIVVTGGAVRLTASGLGCPTWPRCTEGSYRPTGELGLHGAIEFSNRMLTFVLAAVAVATLVTAWRLRPARPSLRRIALILLLGIPFQGVIGGVTVLTDLNPWVVMLHFLFSMILVGLAMLLVKRSGEGDGPPEVVVHPLLRRLAIGLLVAAGVVIYMGAVTTGSGPHAGDLDAVRTGLDPALVAQLHADLVFLLIGLTVATAVALVATGAPADARRAAVILLGVELGQGLIGYTQYFLGLPEGLVALHMLGAATIVAAAANLVLATRVRYEEPATAPEAATAGSPGVEPAGA
jgi:cytochrome c oxidase assembly protein subunit 15